MASQRPVTPAVSPVTKSAFVARNSMFAAARPGAIRVPTKAEEPLPGGPPPLALGHDFLDKLVNESGNAASFPLPGGGIAVGTIEMLKRDAKGKVLMVQGRLSEPAAGFYYFRRQTVPGVAGEFFGNARFDHQIVAYRAEPVGQGGAPMLVARRLDQVMCVGMPLVKEDASQSAVPAARAAATAAGAAVNAPQTHPTNIPIPGYQGAVIPLQSLPGAQGVLYLDFDGEKGPFEGWGTFDAAPSGATNDQIKEVWQRIAEDYQPFNINVTTDRHVFDTANETNRKHVILTPTNTAAPGAGGVALENSWNSGGDQVCWAFYSTGKNAAAVASHEAGHTLGLSHCGQDAPGLDHVEYYSGQGSGETGWAPIMGAGYYDNLDQWSKGEYANANNKEDQTFIIANNNNTVDVRADDYGATLADAVYLEILANSSVSNEGIIETRDDVDAFRFTTSGGASTFTVTPVNAGPDLDVLAEIYDSADVLVASNNPVDKIAATVTANLPAGDYTLRVSGVGAGDPLVTGYSDYGSLGAYLITGAVTGGVKPDRFSVAENSANGTSVGTVTKRVGHGSNPLSYAISSGNTNGAFTIDSATGAITVADSTQLNFEALSSRWDVPARFQLFVTITDGVDAALNENVRVVVAVTDVNEPPTIAGGTATMFAHTKVGTSLFTVVGSDPDRFDFPTFSIIGGNTGNVFKIDPSTGEITILGDIGAATTYTLTVRATDQRTPALTADATVTVTVLPLPPTPAGLIPGTAIRTYFENIGGTDVANLTGNAKFPNSPDSEEGLGSLEGTEHGDNYGSTIRGYIIPPATGSYTFWLASDDSSQLYISTTSSPANILSRASVSGFTDLHQYTKYTSQKSGTISLTAGVPRYFEVRQKEGGGGDHAEVAWQGPGIDRQIIAGRFLAPFYQNYAPAVPAATFTVRRDAYNGSGVGTVAVTDVNDGDTHSFAITGGTGSGIFGIDAATGRIYVSNGAAMTGTSYTLTVRTTDNAATPLSGSGTITINVIAATTINVTGIVEQLWTGISGSAVSDLTNKTAVYPFLPNATRTLSSFESPDNYADNYGSRVRAYIVPPTTGSYTFYIATDDASQLRLSSSNNPASATQIAFITGWVDRNAWTTSTTQKSSARTLTAGQSYYVEVLHKDGIGGDFIQVAWTGPGITTPTVIPGSALLPFDVNTAPVWAGAPYSFTTSPTAANGATVGTVAATDREGGVRTYAIINSDASGAFAINPVSGVISVANSGALPSGQAVNLTIGVQDDGIGGTYPLKAATATAVITVRSRLEQWRMDTFGSDAGNASIAGNLADPDRDGMNNILEYALGSPPRTAGPNGVVVDIEPVGGSNFLRLTADKNPNATDVMLGVEVSGDFTNTASWGGDTTVEINSATTLRARDNTSIDLSGARYIRLKATVP